MTARLRRADIASSAPAHHLRPDRARRRAALQSTPMKHGPGDRAAHASTPARQPIIGPGEESVWDYPRPPRVEPVAERIRVVAGGLTLADTTGAVRVLETAGAPVYYLPPSDVRLDLLQPTERRTVCEWKGEASYWSIMLPSRTIPNAAWSYPHPRPDYEAIRDHLAFYASLVDEAWVGDELATPQPGHFYGGWVTSRIVGPFKGGPGTSGW
jgi:uncharacterized protein (DUF427 family)